jgi:hypothetical protein
MNSVERLRATYEFKPVDHLFRKEFESELGGGRGVRPSLIRKWQEEQGMPRDCDQLTLFNFDLPAIHALETNAIAYELPLMPLYETAVLEHQGEYEIVRDSYGTVEKVFKDHATGYFMPQFLRGPVTSRRGWEDDVKPRLDPTTPERWLGFDERIAGARRAREEQGLMILQGFMGGFMYLRSLLGNVGMLYAVHDTPDLVHDMMATWARLADTVVERIQREIELDELWSGDDICYKSGLLISPDMFREFLMPYYQEVYSKARRRQKRTLYVYIDSDGFVPPAIPLYLEAGVNILCPFEVAAGCDVVEIGRQFPDLVIEGGIDKRVLAAGPEAIDEYLGRVIPPMLERGGFIPTCDHHVPDDVSFANYLYYRQRICELDAGA